MNPIREWTLVGRPTSGRASFRVCQIIRPLDTLANRSNCTRNQSIAASVVRSFIVLRNGQGNVGCVTGTYTLTHAKDAHPERASHSKVHPSSELHCVCQSVRPRDTPPLVARLRVPVSPRHSWSPFRGSVECSVSNRISQCASSRPHTYSKAVQMASSSITAKVCASPMVKVPS